MDMGLQFPGSVKSPLIGKSFTFAIVHSCGKIPVNIEFAKIDLNLSGICISIILRIFVPVLGNLDTCYTT